MVFTIEPGAYLPGWGGVRIEDDVLVTQHGVEVLTNVTTDLLELMDLDDVEEILALVREHGLSEFEIEQRRLRLRLRKDSHGRAVVVARRSSSAACAAPLPPAAAPAARRPRRRLRPEAGGGRRSSWRS